VSCLSGGRECTCQTLTPLPNKVGDGVRFAGGAKRLIVDCTDLRRAVPIAPPSLNTPLNALSQAKKQSQAQGRYGYSQ